MFSSPFLPLPRGLKIATTTLRDDLGCVARNKLLCYSKWKRGLTMTEHLPFTWRHFQAAIILLCVRWYLRYPLSYRQLEEMMSERGLSVDHTTI